MEDDFRRALQVHGYVFSSSDSDSDLDNGDILETLRPPAIPDHVIKSKAVLIITDEYDGKGNSLLSGTSLTKLVSPSVQKKISTRRRGQHARRAHKVIILDHVTGAIPLSKSLISLVNTPLPLLPCERFFPACDSTRSSKNNKKARNPKYPAPLRRVCTKRYYSRHAEYENHFWRTKTEVITFTSKRKNAVVYYVKNLCSAVMLPSNHKCWEMKQKKQLLKLNRAKHATLFSFECKSKLNPYLYQHDTQIMFNEYHKSSNISSKLSTIKTDDKYAFERTDQAMQSHNLNLWDFIEASLNKKDAKEDTSFHCFPMYEKQDTSPPQCQSLLQPLVVLKNETKFDDFIPVKKKRNKKENAKENIHKQTITKATKLNSSNQNTSTRLSTCKKQDQQVTRKQKSKSSNIGFSTHSHSHIQPIKVGISSTNVTSGVLFSTMLKQNNNPNKDTQSNKIHISQFYQSKQVQNPNIQSSKVQQKPGSAIQKKWNVMHKILPTKTLKNECIANKSTVTEPKKSGKQVSAQLASRRQKQNEKEVSTSKQIMQNVMIANNSVEQNLQPSKILQGTATRQMKNNVQNILSTNNPKSQNMVSKLAAKDKQNKTLETSTSSLAKKTNKQSTNSNASSARSKQEKTATKNKESTNKSQQIKLNVNTQFVDMHSVCVKSSSEVHKKEESLDTSHRLNPFLAAIIKVQTDKHFL